MENICKWYNETSDMKRAFDKGLLKEKWIVKYCMNNGNDCVRKQRFEEEGFVSPNYVLPDGTIDDKLKSIIDTQGHF